MNKLIKTNTYNSDHMISGKNNVKINTVCCNQVYDGKNIFNLEKMKQNVVDLSKQVTDLTHELDYKNTLNKDLQDSLNVYKTLSDQQAEEIDELTDKQLNITIDFDIVEKNYVLNDLTSIVSGEDFYKLDCVNDDEFTEVLRKYTYDPLNEEIVNKKYVTWEVTTDSEKNKNFTFILKKYTTDELLKFVNECFVTDNTLDESKIYYSKFINIDTIEEELCGKINEIVLKYKNGTLYRFDGENNDSAVWIDKGDGYNVLFYIQIADSIDVNTVMNDLLPRQLSINVQFTLDDQIYTMQNYKRINMISDTCKLNCINEPNFYNKLLEWSTKSIDECEFKNDKYMSVALMSSENTFENLGITFLISTFEQLVNCLQDTSAPFGDADMAMLMSEWVLINNTIENHAGKINNITLKRDDVPLFKYPKNDTDDVDFNTSSNNWFQISITNSKEVEAIEKNLNEIYKELQSTTQSYQEVQDEYNEQRIKAKLSGYIRLGHSSVMEDDGITPEILATASLTDRDYYGMTELTEGQIRSITPTDESETYIVMVLMLNSVENKYQLITCFNSGSFNTDLQNLMNDSNNHIHLLYMRKFVTMDKFDYVKFEDNDFSFQFNKYYIRKIDISGSAWFKGELICFDV